MQCGSEHTPRTWHELELRRAANKLIVTLDGVEVCAPLDCNFPVTAVGWRPWRNSLRIASLEIEEMLAASDPPKPLAEAITGTAWDWWHPGRRFDERFFEFNAGGIGKCNTQSSGPESNEIKWQVTDPNEVTVNGEKLCARGDHVLRFNRARTSFVQIASTHPPLGPGQLGTLSSSGGSAGAATAAHHEADNNAKKSALDEFARDNNLKPETIKKAYKRFQATDNDKTGMIDYTEFCEVLQVDPSPQGEKLFQLFDYEESGQIDVREFMIGLSNFTGAGKDDKLKFAFMIFDEDGNGVITKGELTRILRANHMASNDSEVARKADTIMAQADKDGDGVVTFDEFVIVSKKFPNILFPAYTSGGT